MKYVELPKSNKSMEISGSLCTFWLSEPNKISHICWNLLGKNKHKHNRASYPWWQLSKCIGSKKKKKSKFLIKIDLMQWFCFLSLCLSPISLSRCLSVSLYLSLSLTVSVCLPLSLPLSLCLHLSLSFSLCILCVSRVGPLFYSTRVFPGLLFLHLLLGN